jgi:8-oxo-dGTP diphosphatase
LKKNISVTCAIIENDDQILAARRGPTMAHPGKWEFPGGKQLPGESLEACLKREILEELHLQVEVVKSLPVVYHTYSPDKSIILHPFLCRWVSGTLSPTEHDLVAWFSPEALLDLDWLPADWPIVQRLMLKL